MLNIVEHPCVKHELAVLRNRETPVRLFRDTMNRISFFLLAEALKTLSVKTAPIQTPLAPTQGYALADRVMFVPILRAGLGFLATAQILVPEATVGFIGIKRNEETAQPMTYYKNIPPLHDESTVFVLDPMLATGGSLCEALAILKQAGAKKCVLVTLLAAPEGVACVERAHPDVAIYTAACDEKLTTNYYIYPGLGDAGDRTFGTL